MSIVTSPYTIPAALKRADDIMGPHRQWEPVNETQRQFLELYDIARGEVSGLPEIESIASWKADAINSFLTQRGFAIQLEPFEPDTFGLAAVFKMLLSWLFPGTPSDIVTPNQKVYPGVLIEDRVPLFEVAGHNSPVVIIPTISQDTVSLTMLDTPPTDEFEMIATAHKFAASLLGRKSVEVHFPMVDLDLRVELSWLRGLWTYSEGGVKGEVTQALRQTKFKMNEFGVKIEEAVAMAVTMEMAFVSSRYVINRPFLMWVNRRGLSLPLFVGYITPEDWKNPGTL